MSYTINVTSTSRSGAHLLQLWSCLVHDTLLRIHTRYPSEQVGECNFQLVCVQILACSYFWNQRVMFRCPSQCINHAN